MSLHSLLTHVAGAGFLLARLQVTTRIRQAPDASKMKKKEKEKEATYQFTKPRSEKKIKKKKKRRIRFERWISHTDRLSSQLNIKLYRWSTFESQIWYTFISGVQFLCSSAADFYQTGFFFVLIRNNSRSRDFTWNSLLLIMPRDFRNRSRMQTGWKLQICSPSFVILYIIQRTVKIRCVFLWYLRSVFAFFLLPCWSLLPKAWCH